ncbi:hypothetical protein [Microbacterium sp. OR16]|uniref:hypothetical protein n=1 Tax=Microbacterium sp. OR16 TaxID=3095345 RepID=UPI0039B54DEA
MSDRYDEFEPNNPLPEFQVPCEHNNVEESVDFRGVSDGYRVCTDCGARQYREHHDQR